MDLTDVINRFRGPLVGLIASWGAAPIDATEIAQDSFADAYLNRKACRGDWEDPETFGRSLRGVARNNYRNWRRSRMRRERRIVSADPSILEKELRFLSDYASAAARWRLAAGLRKFVDDSAPLDSLDPVKDQGLLGDVAIAKHALDYLKSREALRQTQK